MHKILFYNKFISCLYMFRAHSAHHQVKIVLYSIWYHHTCRWPSRTQFEPATFRFVARHLNHCATAVPMKRNNFTGLKKRSLGCTYQSFSLHWTKQKAKNSLRRNGGIAPFFLKIWQQLQAIGWLHMIRPLVPFTMDSVYLFNGDMGVSHSRWRKISAVRRISNSDTSGRADHIYSVYWATSIKVWGQKAIPLQTWTGPEGSRRLRLPDLKTFATWSW